MQWRRPTWTTWEASTYAPFLSCHDLAWRAMAGLVTMAIPISAAENRPSLLICASCDLTKTFGREPHRVHQLI
jgi:hypothetical protein